MSKLDALEHAEAIVVSDTLHDAEAAVKTGLRTIGVLWRLSRGQRSGCAVHRDLPGPD